MRIENGSLVLRDMMESDIEDYVRWYAGERDEWKNFDSPWENAFGSDEEERASWTEYYNSMKELPDDVMRWKFEIEFEGRHVGWVSSYTDLEYIDNPLKHRCIGIDIPECDVWGKGIGSSALKAYMDYFFGLGKSVIYMQTWSGNERALHLMEKLGFKEFYREKDFRLVGGKNYDAITCIFEKKHVG